MRTLGRAERVDLPDYELFDLPAKVDTGAYSSSIDHSFVRETELNGVPALEFVLLREGSKGYTGKKLTTTEFETTEVHNANGTQKRYVIFPNMTVEGEVRRTRLTLADRSKLRYPVLIGRRFLREAEYLVDVSLGKGLPDDEEERKL